jgi:hypothetical protein
MSLRLIGRLPRYQGVAGTEGAPMLLSDVTEWDLLCAPQDDIHGALTDEITAAMTRYGAAAVECHSSQYAFTDADVEALFAELAANPASRFLFDSSQAIGTVEAPLLAAFRQSVPAAQVAVGTSPVAGQILHTKATVLLYPDGTGWSLTGSFNLSFSATEQFNIDDLVRSRSRGELIASRIDAMFAWVQAHEGGGG